VADEASDLYVTHDAEDVDTSGVERVSVAFYGAGDELV
jgi:hypothetical protein